MITNKQAKVLDTIKDFFSDHGKSPSLTDLQTILKISTKRGVVQYLESLEKKGYIQRLGSQGIKLSSDKKSGDFLNLPILGYANCGQPLAYAEELQIGNVQVQHKLLSVKHDLFVLIAKGDSMNQRQVNGKYINDKDYVVVAKDQPINNKDVVVAVIDNAATIKTFVKSDELITLYPESNNPTHQPIFLSGEDDGMIIGKVITVLTNSI
jgi:repressor LexA